MSVTDSRVQKLRLQTEPFVHESSVLMRTTTFKTPHVQAERQMAAHTDKRF